MDDEYNKYNNTHWKRKSKATELSVRGKVVNTLQENLEAYISFAFTFIRCLMTTGIVVIFVAIDWKMVVKLKAEGFDIFAEANFKIVKYSVIFLTFQLVIFSQGFGFSSMVKLITAISNAIRGKRTND